ncbi:MAG: gamma-glutamylcyclotransferase [Alphaproteobacteria bacterium]|nr:gamma-glutamylcyclotransferase [Alphaproteobacteria bacterium]
MSASPVTKPAHPPDGPAQDPKTQGASPSPSKLTWHIRLPEREANPFDASRFDWRPGEDLNVFAYGSLIWNPGFPHIASELALLRGYHRAFCILSHRYRGTPERPGLVLGLDWGGSCAGVLYTIAAKDVPEVLPYLWDREMVNNTYRPTVVGLRLLRRSGSRLRASEPARATAFVVRRGHKQYRGSLSRAEMCRMIREAAGSAGPCREYLENTVGHLERRGIPDSRLAQILAEIDAPCAD